MYENPLIRYSVRPSVKATPQDGTEWCVSSVLEFAGHLRDLRKHSPIDPATGIDAKGGWLFCAPRKDTAGTWKQENTAPRSWIAIDLDLVDKDGNPIPCDLSLLREWLSDRASLLWETHSHTPDSPRYRVVLFLDREIDPDHEHADACRGVIAFWRDWGIVDLTAQQDQSYCKACQGMYSPPRGRDYLSVVDSVRVCADQLIDKGRAHDDEDDLTLPTVSEPDAVKLPEYAPVHATEDALTRQAQRIAESALQTLGATPKGQRHPACLKAGRTIGGLVGGGFLDPSVLDQLRQVAQSLAVDREEVRDFTRAVIDAFHEGQGKPIDLRSDPQWVRKVRRTSHAQTHSAPPVPDYVGQDAGAWTDSEVPPPPEPEPSREPPSLFDGLHTLPEYLQHRGGRRLRTGIESLDKALGGGFPNGLHVVGGLSGLGKTALAIEVALGVVKAGGRVLYLSLEMDYHELSKRVAQRVYAQSGENLTNQQLTEKIKADPGKYEDTVWGQSAGSLRHEVANRLKIADLEFLGSAGLPAVRSVIRDFLTRCEVETPEVFPLVIVDYLQYIQQTEKRSQDRRVFMIEVAQALKAETLTGGGCVVLALSSLVRDMYYDRPCSESLKEAGEIEYTAQSVNILHYRVSSWDGVDMAQIVADKKNERVKYLTLYCTKNRSDPPTDALLDFDTTAGTITSGTAPDPYMSGTPTPPATKTKTKTAPAFNSRI